MRTTMILAMPIDYTPSARPWTGAMPLYMVSHSNSSTHKVHEAFRVRALWALVILVIRGWKQSWAHRHCAQGHVSSWILVKFVCLNWSPGSLLDQECVIQISYHVWRAKMMDVSCQEESNIEVTVLNWVDHLVSNGGNLLTVGKTSFF